jgi:serine/threonine-protein kinase
VRLEGLDAPGDSLAYAAPECARGQPPDARSEVFSLGVVLLQLLTGRHLIPGAERFEAEVRRAGVPPTTDRGEPVLEACARELEERLRAYGPVERESATRAVSVELRPLVHRALAVGPEERHAHPAELAHALREHLRRTGPPAGPLFGPARVRAELEALGL